MVPEINYFKPLDESIDASTNQDEPELTFRQPNGRKDQFSDADEARSSLINTG